MIQPLRRSPVHRELLAAGARLVPFRDALVAADFGDPAAERAALSHLALLDLSPLPRTGLKGPGTPEWLASRGLDLPPPNRAAGTPDGGLLARLGPREVLVLGPPDPSGAPCLADELDAAWPAAPGSKGYPVPRRDTHFWFHLGGAQAPATLAKLCAVDLRPHRFAALEIAQTQAAGLASVVIIRDLGEPPAFHLLADSASAAYAWACLLDAMAEFGGRPAGLDALAP